MKNSNDKKLYLFLKDKGAFVKKGDIYALTDQVADSLLKREIVEPYTPPSSPKQKSFKLTKSAKGEK